MAAQGFIHLLRLAEQGRQRQRTDQGDRQRWSGVGFQLAGKALTTPLGEVSEVIVTPEVTPISGGQPWLVGLANIRGRLLPISDLALFLDCASGSSPKRKVIIVDQPGLYSGLLVDEVMGIQHFEQSSYRHQLSRVGQDDQLLDAIGPYSTGQFERSSEVWPLFLLSRLMQDARYLDASA